ncbi:hypothetical protein [Micromonospora sp. 067-2]|uniref:hypothetical protein n=1 Tax=Micromonospora sp. 067-2 TaxID=2789270 RepID=UPI00397DC73C
MTARRAARALLVGGLLLALLVAGCGVRPSDVITGRPATAGPSEGIGLYLLRYGQLVLVITPIDPATPPEKTLGWLAAGPDDEMRRQGLTSEVPEGVIPASPVTVTADRSGLTVTMTGPVLPLSAAAADQIACTLADAAARTDLADTFASVTIAGPDGARPPRVCPVVK